MFVISKIGIQLDNKNLFRNIALNNMSKSAISSMYLKNRINEDEFIHGMIMNLCTRRK